VKLQCIMKFFRCTLPLVAASGPVTKVVDMLKGLQSTALEEQQKEKVLCKEYDVWSAREIARTDADLANTNSDADRAVGKSNSAASAAERAQKRFIQYQAESATAEAQLQSDFTEFDQESTERKATISQLTGDDEQAHAAFDILSSMFQNSKAVAALQDDAFIQIQKLAQAAPVTGTAALFNYIRGMAPPKAALSEVAPQTTKYAAHASAGTEQILSMVGDMVAELDETLASEQNALSNLEHNHQMNVKNLENEISVAGKKAAKDSQEAAAQTSAKGTSDSAVLSLQTRASDLHKSLLQLHGDAQTHTEVCMQNQQVRANELTALEQAIVIIESDVSPNYKPRRGGAALMQISGAAIKKSSQQIRQKGLALKSKALLGVAEAVEAGGPFDSIVGMINDMLTKLVAEHKKEMTDKAVCDEKIDKNAKDLEATTNYIATLTSENDRLGSSADANQEKKQQFHDDIVNREAAQAEANEFRSKAKTANEQVISEAGASAVALQRALAVLADVYPANAPFVANDLLQISKTTSSQAPAVKAYSGMSNESKGIMGLLETILADCHAEKSETEADEKRQQSEYKSFSEETEHFLKKTNSLLNQHDRKLQQDNYDLEKVGANLANAEKIVVEHKQAEVLLQKQCVQKSLSYEERVAAREAEISALKEVLSLLQDL